ncbi:hypothetical protein SARC_06836 [Sphaeroforma arctica JP610]|uniref:Valine--tRNA ligase, mitochondrial n=1 Tax=Sphaeroforma arctica JP610 TaxID=667725 RepID=A0A0L0FVE7_9EUKA|nr:hypothetical protein SARC_06836 [Sphaeroforma arctica JP610]KNC80812.1 hypothetical protein SARC_06836 [Sphaeroforma arctica JP610]|eukprot:XP_014154714.1 hypothetical protein SARC_06836 [Sphaeroforma arctica JP610]
MSGTSTAGQSINASIKKLNDSSTKFVVMQCGSKNVDSIYFERTGTVPLGSRRSAVGDRQSAIGSRQSALGARQSALLAEPLAKLKALKEEWNAASGKDWDAEVKAAEKEKKDAEKAAKKDAQDNGPKKPVDPEKLAAKNKAKAEKLAKFEAKKKALAEAAAKKQAAGGGAKKKEKKEKVEVKFTNTTASGDYKDLESSDFASYHPNAVETAWYSWWEKEGLFKPEKPGETEVRDNPKGVFMMAIPPPNVTGTLHLGHALTNAIEDTLTRWQRMRGKTVLWNPGCDHAGIATQVVVEKKVWREEQKTRHDLGREEFLKRVWEWKEVNGDLIYNQLRGLGASVDWDRAVFTMDEKCMVAVTEAFVQLYDKKKIFRDSRLVNWSSQLNSAISDLEVDHKELTGRTMMTVVGHGDKEYEFGVLTSFAYQFENPEDGEIVVATTRLETMLADTAVAVHPEDPKYAHAHGKHLIHPFSGRKIPIITDTYVEIGFGSGAVKITPGHDPNDYDMGKRHDLPILNMLNDDGTVNGLVKEFEGMKRFDARDAVLAALEAKGLFRGKTPNAMVIPICSRTKDIVEPMVKPQWFVDCTSMNKRALDAVQNGDLRLVPDQHEKTWYHWLGNDRPWCVSRQLWWGHRIPAYYCEVKGKQSDAADSECWVVGRSEEEALKRAVAKFGVSAGDITLHQDPDVLDTWFSSGLFPFSIFGWPEKTADLARFYPGTLLETGHDILFFWVARMVMLSLELNDVLPFSDVYLHALIRDAHGRKMSKSLGNVLDPLDVIHGITLKAMNDKLANGNLDPKEVQKATEGQSKDFPDGIPECGTDALRMALASYTLPGKDVNLDIQRVVGYRFFCNKLWNALRYARTLLGDDFVPKPREQAPTDAYGPMDVWILSRLSHCVKTMNESFEAYAFPAATQAISGFWQYEFCDVYLECSKSIMNGTDQERIAICREVFYTCLDVGLRLLHPIMCFLTEELYQRLPRRAGSEGHRSIMVAEYPEEALYVNEQAEQEWATAFEVVRNVRSLKAEYLNDKAKPEVIINVKSEAIRQLMDKYIRAIQTLTLATTISISVDSPPPQDKGCVVAIVNDTTEAYVGVKGLIDPAKEVQKNEKKLAETQAFLEKAKAPTLKEDYEQKVPEAVRATHTKKISQLEGEIDKLGAAIDMYKAML